MAQGFFCDWLELYFNRAHIDIIVFAIFFFT